MRKRGYRPAAIALELKRHRRTITREIRRNLWRQNGIGYYPLKAQSYTNERRRVARRGTQFSSEEWAFVEQLLRLDWSPEQIVGWCARFGIGVMSHETIYRHSWADKKRGGTLNTHLRIITKNLRKRYGTYDSRGRLAGKRHISERPAEMEIRTRLGHWEGDTVHGSTQHTACIVTMGERTSGFVAIEQLDRCGATETTARLCATRCPVFTSHEVPVEGAGIVYEVACASTARLSGVDPLGSRARSTPDRGAPT